MVGVNPLFTHHMPEIWPDPDRFDPMRFTEEAQRNRHRFAWVPFGGGAHMCLGLHFAYMQAKCFARHFLQNLSVSLERGLQAGMADVADPKTARRAASDGEGGVMLPRAYSINVVSCAPSSATNTAISSAGSVLLALAETRCVAPGGSKNDCPTLNVSTGPPASCERISPLVM